MARANNTLKPSHGGAAAVISIVSGGHTTPLLTCVVSSSLITGYSLMLRIALRELLQPPAPFSSTPNTKDLLLHTGFFELFLYRHTINGAEIILYWEYF